MSIKKYLNMSFTLITMPFTLTIRAFRHIIKEWRVLLGIDPYALTEHHPSDGLGIIGGGFALIAVIIILIASQFPPYPLMNDMEVGLTKEQMLMVELATQQQHHCSPAPDNNSN